jgi:hypothetical protein
MSRRRDQRYPLNQPPDGMVVEPALPTNNPMTPSQRSVNNSLATADEENLPPVTDAQGNPLPLDEFSPPDDAMVDPTPTEVRRATMSVPAKGVHFNFDPFQQIAQLHAAGQTQEAIAMRDSLDPQSRYVYDNIKNMKKVPASEAARLADEFRQNQDRQAMQQQTPQARALDERKLTDAQKTMQRADNMIFLMDNLRGGARGGDKKDQGVKRGEEKWRSRVGSVQGRWPTMLSTGETLGWNADFASLKGMINLDEAVRNAGQGSLSDGERALMAQAASLGLEQARDEPGFESAFERMYDLALETKNRAQSKLSGAKETPSAQPAAAPANAAQSAAQPAPAAVAPGFQPGKIYRDGQGRPARFRGYDAQGNPTFEKI